MSNENTTETNECRARILVVENDPRTANLHQKNLARWGYESFVAEGSGKALLEDAVKKAYQYACHVALVDMRLLDDYDQNDRSGIELVPKLKPTLSIIVSGSGKDRDTVLFAQKRMGAEDFIGKEETLSRLRESIFSATERAFACKHGPTIIMDESLIDDIMNRCVPGKPMQVREVIKYLFSSSGHVTVKPLQATVIKHAHQAKGHTLTLLAQVDKQTPCIIKLASREHIQREAENYERHVKSQISGRFYSLLRNVSILWHLGGIAYDFLGSEHNKFLQFSDYYSRPIPVDHISVVMEHLFQVWGQLYRRQQHYSLTTLHQCYWRSEHQEIEMWVQDISSKGEKFITIDSTKLCNPFSWLFNHLTISKTHTSQLTTIHGELVGTNILVDDLRQAWVIDYDRVGEGHILGDFVQFEIDLLFNFGKLEHLPPKVFWDLCMIIVAPERPGELLPVTESVWLEPSARRAYLVLKEIRRLASEVTKYANVYEYFEGLLLTLILNLYENRYGFVDSSSDASVITYPYQLAAILCTRLNTLDGPWPPHDWPNVEWLTELDFDRYNKEVDELRNKLRRIEPRLRILGDQAPQELAEEAAALRKRLSELGESMIP